MLSAGLFYFELPLFGGRLVFRFVLRPEFGNFFPCFLACVSVFDLKHGGEFIELHVCLVHFDQIVLNHQTPLAIDLPADQAPFFLEYRFIHHVVLLGYFFAGDWRLMQFLAVVYFPNDRQTKFIKFIVLRSGENGAIYQ